MSETPSRAIRLFGTEQPVTPPRILRAGPLTAELEAGNLRYIRFGGIEVIRAISFIVRDRDWGTYDPVIEDLTVDERADGFVVTYTARAADAAQAFSYSAHIEGQASGRLVFSSRGTAETDFLTNRTGFVILHPIDGVAGERVEMAHTDGRVVEHRFPDLIDPVQPMMDLRQLTHWTDGLRVACRMEGDTFEMEDQRNWTDASYKTYVRPLALPWPYTIARGETLEQAITLTIEGNAATGASDAPVTVAIGSPTGQVPPLGLGLDPADTAAASSVASTVSQIGAAHIICHHDARRGHDEATLRAQVAFAREIGAEPWLEAVVTSVDGFESEIAALGKICEALGSPFRTVLVSPAPDLKCTLPGSEWPPAPPAREMYEVTRRAFPEARIGGGMFSYFTELNRKRPPTEALDLVSFTTSALVHAGDDRSVTETVQALPAIARSAVAIAGERPYAVGPSAMGMRDNPYGEAPKENPENIRQAMNRNDPRQRGLLGAAWALGYFARFAYGGASAIAIGAPVGAHGAVAAQTGLPQPFFDTAGGVYPVFHVLRGLAARKGAELLALDISRPGQLLGLAIHTGEGTEVWLANLTGEAITIAPDFAVGAVARLDADSFAEAAKDPAFLDNSKSAGGEPLTLDAYAVVRLMADRAS
ncbi:hypothetical protein EMQ25_06705 [Arsenicitalea aurantiaca]|uniref:Uncharacterized protein n=1 Tax=Arsenicitalea aurantiaca TaxID=1783274 RepID=A0A433XFG4_9HYPH|nr:hypothetical protein [Arsenicitalea aurantiaca]RUT32825.1 hypothetical protein EMQ25_06705 [Arsenicitalea aurantiaca]